jgi:hypothetical protein
MAVPTISQVQSVLYYSQWQPWAFHPWASNSPTVWTASPLPPGITLNTATGKLSGAAEMPGVYVFALTAINGDGPSAPAVFTAGISATSWVAPTDALDVILDLASGIVTINGVSSVPGALLDKQPVLAWLSSGDAKLLHIRPVKNGVTADIAFETLRLAAKSVEPESAIVSSSAFARVATGPDTYYRMAVELDGDALAAELANAEDDYGTLLRALFELEWTAENTLEPVVGPETLVGSSQYFCLGVERELQPNA